MHACGGVFGGSMRALIVDGDAVAQEVLRAYLLHYGVEHGCVIKIQVLPDARRALALLTMKEDACDVVFLAVRLLDLGGDEVYSLLAQFRPQIVKRIVFVTAYRDGLVANLPEFKLNILAKPFRYKQLVDAMAIATR